MPSMRQRATRFKAKGFTTTRRRYLDDVRFYGGAKWSERQVRQMNKRVAREWSAGNGQCPECWGVPATWHGHPCHMDALTIGHQVGCPLAAALGDLGEEPLMQGRFTSDVVYERFVSAEGFLGTLPCRANPQYAGPSNCSQGTVGCTEPEHRKPTAPT